MPEQKLKILLIEGLARQVLPVSKSLRELGCEVTTYNTSRLDPGYASRFPHRKLLGFFDVAKPEHSYKAVKNALEDYHYDLVIPMNDDAAILLAKHKEELSALTTVVCNDWNIFEYASDKLKTMKVCMNNCIPCPKTFLNKDEFLISESTVNYPVVVKPRTSCAAVGFYVAYDKNDLLGYYDKAEKKLGPMLIQEYIPQNGFQYKAELYVDSQGILKGACVFAKVRWYPINGGSSTMNETVNRPDIVENCKRLLNQISWRGYADIDLIEDTRDGSVKILEINPRITGSVKICYNAGVNFSQMIVDDYLGKEVKPQFDVKHVYLRYMLTDILWLLKSEHRFNAKPSWFDFHNTCDQIFSWDDLWAGVAFTLQGFAKLFKDKKRRQI